MRKIWKKPSHPSQGINPSHIYAKRGLLMTDDPTAMRQASQWLEGHLEPSEPSWRTPITLAGIQYALTEALEMPIPQTAIRAACDRLGFGLTTRHGQTVLAARIAAKDDRLRDIFRIFEDTNDETATFDRPGENDSGCGCGWPGLRIGCCDFEA